MHYAYEEETDNAVVVETKTSSRAFVKVAIPLLNHNYGLLLYFSNAVARPLPRFFFITAVRCSHSEMNNILNESNERCRC